MSIIWKYNLMITGSQVIDMPVGAKVLTIQVQDNIPCIWVLVKQRAEKELVTLSTYETGQPIPDYIIEGNIYIGTCQLDNGATILHIFKSNKE